MAREERKKGGGDLFSELDWEGGVAVAGWLAERQKIPTKDPNLRKNSLAEKKDEYVL